MQQESSTISAASRSNIFKELLRHRNELARGMLELVPPTDAWQAELARYGEDLDGFLKRHLWVLVDYLAEAVRTGDDIYRDLFVAELEKIVASFYVTDLEARRDSEGTGEGLAAALKGAADIVTAGMNGYLAQGHARTLRNVLDGVIAPFMQPARQSMKVLLVGDCLFTDILPFLQTPLLTRGVALVPTFVTPKNQSAARQLLVELAAEKFDLVFFSPFSYEYSRELSQFLYAKNAGMRRQERERLIDRALTETKKTIELLARAFDCRVYIHNASNLVRHEPSVKSHISRMLTASMREDLASTIDRWLGELVESQNALTFRHLHVLDEHALIRANGGDRLGDFLHVGSSLQHPCRAGIVLAQEYRKIIMTHARLMERKLVICDLDNTLWDGVIGEGAVRHFRDRQQTLKTLRNKGVLLAINSKNDPANVNFVGGLLSDDDFVARRINWNPKAANIAGLHAELNLKPKNSVFIDDRADERFLAEQAFPDLLALDATAEDSWQELAHWAELIDSSLAEDRTQAYRERAARSKYIELQMTDKASEQEMLSGLGLKVDVRYAAAADLPRVADLVNRTNQWNLCASRTSLPEVRAQHASDDYRIIVADAADNFGSMGTVCLAIAHVRGDALDIPVFVLSCRVFGYDIERAVLNFIKRAMPEVPGAVRITGSYMPTAANAPCKDMYRDNDFEREDDLWVWRQGEIITPAWLSITESSNVAVKRPVPV